jgi:dUTP pyrophosphatase
MRIAQMIVARVEHVQILEVKELTQTQRGERGFGSTGVGHGPL